MIALQEASQIRTLPTHREAQPREIKKYLENKFGHKFSVRRGRGTGSAYIDVNWIDGPAGDAVRSACNQFNDTDGDDIMTDLWVGSQYTTEQRSISPKAYLYCAYVLSKYWKIPMPKVTVEVSKWTGKPSAYIKRENDPELPYSNGCRNYYFTEKLNLFIGKTNFNFVDFKNPKYYEVTQEKTGTCWLFYCVCGDIETAKKEAKKEQGVITEVRCGKFILPS